MLVTRCLIQVEGPEKFINIVQVLSAMCEVLVTQGDVLGPILFFIYKIERILKIVTVSLMFTVF